MTAIQPVKKLGERLVFVIVVSEHSHRSKLAIWRFKNKGFKKLSSDY